MTVSCQATLTAEMLTRLARPAFRAGLDIEAPPGRVYEIVVPDGTVALPLVPSLFDRVGVLLIGSDAALELTLGTVGLNTPIALASRGMVALLGGNVRGVDAASVTYTPGTGTAAHLVVVALGVPDAWRGGCARLLDDATVSAGLTHCWDLDEASGLRVDHVGNYQLTPVQTGGSATTLGTAPGIDGEGVVFPGAKALVAVNASNVPDMQVPFTLACWVKFDALPSADSMVLVGKGQSLSAGQYEFYLIARSDNRLFQASFLGGFVGLVAAPDPVQVGLWYLVVTWHDGTACRIQVNNGVVTTDVPSFTDGVHIAAFGVGGIGSAVSTLEGVLDVVMIWNRALTSQAERDVIWNGGRGC